MNGQDGRQTKGALASRVAAVVAVASMAPVTVFAVATVGRLLQPLPNEPAGTEERLYEWFVGLPAPAIAVLFIALPLLAMATAGAILWRSWQRDPDLRADTRAAVALGWRFLRRPAVWLSAAVLAVGLVLGLAIIVHGIAG